MAKNWTTISNVNTMKKKSETREQKCKRERRFSNAIKNTQSLSLEEMKKESDELYKNKKAYEDHLIRVYEDKILKSDKLIKQALRIKKERESKNKDAK